MLGKGDDTEARLDIPDLNFAVIGTSDDALAVRRVDKGVHRIEVPLLLEDVRLRLPLPHE